METATFSVLELFKLGGIVMWPLLLFSIAAVAISIERIIFLSYHNLEIHDLADSVNEYVQKKDYSGAAEYLSDKTKRRMGARILLAIIEQVKPKKIRKTLLIFTKNKLHNSCYLEFRQIDVQSSVEAKRSCYGANYLNY